MLRVQSVPALSRLAAIAAVVAATACSDKSSTDVVRSSPQGLSRINHVIIIYLENHSFDNTYAEFPGAAGLPEAVNAPKQVDSTGAVYANLPQTTGAPFPISPALPNAPFPIQQYMSSTQAPRDLVHRFYQEQLQIDGGRMDRFAAISDAKGLVMGYYHTSGLPLAAEASRYTLMDHFFHSAFGGSFLNHIFLIAAAPPVFPNAPASIVAQLDAQGNLVKDGQVTPDGYVVNTSFTVNAPHPASANPATLVPNQTMPTVGDRLNDKGVSWAWYSGGWNDANAGHPDPT
ncbi:MAG TPA: alkaline phosphatase family protein, partial [Longimicrobiales bacterium]